MEIKHAIFLFNLLAPTSTHADCTLNLSTTDYCPQVYEAGFVSEAGGTSQMLVCVLMFVG